MSDPAWAKGFPLDFLKEVAALFRAEFKPHSYGAFGIPKERDIADVLAADQLMWSRSREGNKAIEAAATFRLVSQKTVHEDFTGRRATLLSGDVFVRAIAGSADAKDSILCKIELNAGARGIWVEGHVENPELVALMESRGFEPVMTKVSASSDLKGLWLKAAGLNPERYPAPLPDADRPGVAVLAPAWLQPHEHAAILQELETWGERWAQHYSGYNKGRSWSAFALRGYDAGDPGFIIKPAEMSQKWKEDNAFRLEAPCTWTPASRDFPNTLQLLQRIPGEKQRVRFMRLSGGGGELTRHADITDREAGTADRAIARLHIPIRTDPRCEFRSWDLAGVEHRLHMPERSLSYIDTRKPHAVINPAEAERIHLVVDCHSGPELRALIAASDEKAPALAGAGAVAV